MNDDQDDYEPESPFNEMTANDDVEMRELPGVIQMVLPRVSEHEDRERTPRRRASVASTAEPTAELQERAESEASARARSPKRKHSKPEAAASPDKTSKKASHPPQAEDVQRHEQLVQQAVDTPTPAADDESLMVDADVFKVDGLPEGWRLVGEV